jgi:hypothetical protein
MGLSSTIVKVLFAYAKWVFHVGRFAPAGEMSNLPQGMFVYILDIPVVNIPRIMDRDTKNFLVYFI